MVNYPPEYCPYCGTELDGVDEPTAYYCEGCDGPVFYNPTPSARVAVVDGDAVLLVTRPDGAWITPGGKIEVGNQPAEHAAKELEEETNLVVDPDDLRLFAASTNEVSEDEHVVTILFAVPATATSGRLRAGSDAGRARFWTTSEFADEDGDHVFGPDASEHDGVTRLIRDANTVLSEPSA